MLLRRAAYARACGMSVLYVGDPGPGVSLGEHPCDKRAERSNEEEPEQALGSVSRTTRDVEVS